MQQDAVPAKLQKSKIIINKNIAEKHGISPTESIVLIPCPPLPIPCRTSLDWRLCLAGTWDCHETHSIIWQRFNINMAWRRLTPVGINMTSNRHHVYTANLKSCKNIQQLKLRWSDARWSQYLIWSDLWSLSSLKIGRCTMWVAKPSAASAIQSWSMMINNDQKWEKLTLINQDQQYVVYDFVWFCTKNGQVSSIFPCF